MPQPIPLVRVDHAPDPAVPGRTVYGIWGPSAQAVQLEIERLLSEVGDNGYGQFKGPERSGAGYMALGHTVEAV